ncbi:MAG: acyl-CoA dehydrogenase [Alphaproteobacteria bacterium]|jgi:acyl-CoA dehydrogenase|nr:acyl-CoA dehydrogenase [Alphaproteobacteria bacterium]MBT4086693.1 acyl-CoA dehydrogenase [Alphaproteobacteria bacterium]MBT4546287.1 acyl-CoA dehydrogenase [Alphaproteobacteria bacterium]MBT5161171.1 acyl-CoA dehydrogenase [Alphaproteobacteria bacterium]MBT5919846.1 acyl-CoA dehydrogenase [Alphaproteobacteria bacterium]
MQNSIYNTEELVLFRDQLGKFIETEIVPQGDAWEQTGKVPREVFKKMGDLGFLGLRYAEQYGGTEMNTVATAVLAEELGRSTFSGFAISVLVHTDMASPHLNNAGNKDQLARYMPGIIAGDTVTAVAVTEPDAGSDVAGIKTRAVKDGDDWVLNGSKMFITNGVYGDVYFVAAKTDPDVKGSRGITIFIVEKGTPGFTVGRALDKMGWRCSDTAELVFDNCRVPAENILGEVNRGFYAIMQNFQNERTVIGAMAMGEAQKAIDITLDYVKDRKAFGANLWDKQTIRQRLAMRQAEVEAGRQLVYHAAWLDAQGLDCVKEVSAVKAYCGELVNKVMYDCQQFHGGSGYLRENPIERMTRDARVQSIGGGATEVMLEEIAKRI